MSRSFNDMLYLFSCNAKNIVPQIEHKINISEIMQLAQEQNIGIMVLTSLKKAYMNGSIQLEEEELQSLNQQIYMLVTAQARKQKAIAETIYYLEASGIECCVLKGEVLAQNYAEPILRVSSDTDILIKQADEKKVYNLLKNKNFKCQRRNLNSHHLVCTHEKAGVIEFHVSLYDEIYEDIWFSNKKMRCEGYRHFTTGDGYTYKTLGVTNGATFVAMHLIKHFLTSGVGIRQIMDILLYNACYMNEIDWTYFDDYIKQLNFDYFYDVCVSMGKQYLQFNDNELHYINNATSDVRILEALLEDIEKGGVYGKNDVYRQSFSRVYTQLKINTSGDVVQKNSFRKWWLNAIVINIFPSAEVLSEKYKYASKSRFMFILAWLHRNFNFFVLLLNRSKNVKNYMLKGNDQDIVVQKRIELIKELGML